ncbi:glucokinase [Sphingomonas vulcanisoli]|uniref:glucokinase n=1 Tax=Sphingomonas vulcanisoli TaxID=1658060 RepID=UPI0014229B53
MQVVAVDLGGTNVRFAIADVAGGKVTSIAPEVTLHTADYASFALAWGAFEEKAGSKLPRAVVIAIAAPIEGDAIKLTNNPWVIRPSALKQELDVDDFLLINDFGAVAYAVAAVEPHDLHHLCGPDEPLPATGVISVVGPGTGLGVALILRDASGLHVIETEGGHGDFAPLDVIEDAILALARQRYRRVSNERIVSGPGLSEIYQALAQRDGRAVVPGDDKTLWTAALEGSDPHAAAALDRFCLSLGAVAGDLALEHGAHGVVIAGGLGLRLKDRLALSGFAERFTAKGRFERRMASIPVKLITYPQPGLLGAAAAYAKRVG